MTFNIRRWSATAAATVLASLLCVGGGVAQATPHSASVQAGVSSALNATAHVGPISIAISSRGSLGANAGAGTKPSQPGAGTKPGQPGTSPQPAQPGTSPQPAQPGTSPQPAQPGAGTASQQVELQVNAQLAALQSRLSASRRQLRAALRRGRSAERARVRALRARVGLLQRQAARLAVRFQQRAIAQARANAHGAWLVVNSAGVVVDQSGGMSVTHVGTGAYDVSSGANTATCLSSALNGRVQVTGPRGPVDSGFFIAAPC